MVKDAPNQILMNMIGQAQTSRKIFEDSDILMFPVVLITLTRMDHTSVPKSGSHYPHYVWKLIQSVYDSLLSASMRQVSPCLKVYAFYTVIICRLLQPF